MNYRNNVKFGKSVVITREGGIYITVDQQGKEETVLLSKGQKFQATGKTGVCSCPDGKIVVALEILFKGLQNPEILVPIDGIALI